MFSHWAYVLIGDNNTGKTSFQRFLVEALCGQSYDRLPRNVVKTITHPRAPRKLETLFTANRSYQEKLDEYKSIENYLERFFADADLCVLSSHSHSNAIDEIRDMFRGLVSRGYNVAGIFWSNEFGADAQKISREIPWQERLWIENPRMKNLEKVPQQIRAQAFEFAEMLVARARLQ